MATKDELTLRNNDGAIEVDTEYGLVWLCVRDYGELDSAAIHLTADDARLVASKLIEAADSVEKEPKK